MINKLIMIISSLSEVIAKMVLFTVIFIAAAIYKFLRISLGFLLPVLKKALVYIIVILVLLVIIYKFVL